MPRIRRTDAQWAELIRECKASGLSDMEWLKQNHISPSSFYNKLHKLFGETEQNTPLPEKRLAKIPESHDIVEMTFGGELRSIPVSSGIQETAVTLRVGIFSVDITNSAGPDFIRNTVLALRAIC